MPSVAHVRAGFAEAVNRVTYGGERIIIEKRGKAVAALVHIRDLQAIEAREEAEDVAEARAILAHPAKYGPWSTLDGTPVPTPTPRRPRPAPKRRRR